MLANRMRMKLAAKSKTSCSESVLLLKPICKTGTSAALYAIMKGGIAPGGICRTAACE